VEAAAVDARGVVGLPSRDQIENVVVLGMGGSGIAGDVVVAAAAPFMSVPVTVVKGYELPDFVGASSLVFAMSFSGDTEETLEAGLALTGTEVKSLRAHRANLRDSYARIKNGEAFLESVHIGAYAPAGQFSHKETRARKLLMHRREIDRLWGRVREKGYSIVPLKLYFKNGRAKVELGLAKGKHSYDKRAEIARKTSEREIERALKGRNR